VDIVPFLGRETFLRNKRAAGRAKDLADIDRAARRRLAFATTRHSERSAMTIEVNWAAVRIAIPRVKTIGQPLPSGARA
jgi:hypothetical protein